MTLAKETPVIFRRWRDQPKTVFALFPTIPEDCNGYTCSCYEHVGQHSGADPGGCIARSTPTFPHDYADLKAELESIGYRLRIYSRETAGHRNTRHHAALVP